jgi:poly(A) polymerase
MNNARLLDAPWLTSGSVTRVLELLDGNGEEARVVGGAVRNALLNVAIGDVDIATTALPDEVVRRAKAAGIKSVPTGIEHGTVTLVLDAHPFEVTTLREDTETFGRKAKVAFGRDWVGDAHRRDFTINALSVGPDGVVHDYVGGLEDLAARRVRFIGEAELRIAEDYLRVLRFFRIHAAFGAGEVDRAGYLACIGARAGLATLSAERVRMELLKLLVADGAVAGGGLPAWTRRGRGDGSIVWARIVTATGCCWPGRGPAAMPIRRPGASSRCCRSAGARRNSRSRPPISSRAALPKARRLATC